MKKSQPSKRTVVIVERRKLPLDFSFNAPSDGQKIKKMRMLNTRADAATLTHIISTNDALNKENLTISHCDSQTNKYTKHRVEEDVEIERLGDTDVANSDIEVDIEGLDDEERQQIEAASKAKRDQGKNGKAEQTITPDLGNDELTRKRLAPTSKPIQKVEPTMSVVKLKAALAEKPANVLDRGN